MSLLIGNCTADAGLGSRLCTNTETLSVDCIPPAQVCDFNTADCPNMSDELNCPCEYILNVKLLPACACVQALAIVLFSITCVYRHYHCPILHLCSDFSLYNSQTLFRKFFYMI